MKTKRLAIFSLTFFITLFFIITSSVFAQAPTVNGLLYGDGDIGRYTDVTTAPLGHGMMYKYLDGNVLYVAVVVNPSVNDNVFDGKVYADDGYVQSVNWKNKHWAKDLVNSDHMQLKLTCGTTVWEWKQDYLYDADNNHNPAEVDWLSDVEGQDGAVISGGVPPIIASASSMQWNILNSDWDVTVGDLTNRSVYDEWKSPFDPSSPNSLGSPNNLGYPYWDDTNKWEWQMVYEMSIDLSGCSGDVTIEAVAVHNSPFKTDVEISYDFGDAPSDYVPAFSEVQSTLIRLGALVDGETTSNYSLNAQGDDVDVSNDEDGVSFTYTSDGSTIPGYGLLTYTDGSLVDPGNPTDAEVFNISAGAATSITITLSVFENITRTVYVKGWIDLDFSGTFDSWELLTIDPTNSVVVVPITDVQYDITTFARFIISTQDVDANGGGIGEVEDYALVFNSNSPPIAVSLTNFKALVVNEQVQISWESESEINHAGYNIYRSDSKNGTFVKINSILITSDVSSEQQNRNYEYIDAVALSGTFYYKLEDISLDGSAKLHGPVMVSILTNIAEEGLLPAEFILEQNYPNPFNPTTTISYSIPQNENVTLEIFDLTGKQIRTLVSENQSGGQYSVVWDARNEVGLQVTSGVYLYRIQAGAFNSSGRMTLLK